MEIEEKGKENFCLKENLSLLICNLIIFQELVCMAFAECFYIKIENYDEIILETKCFFVEDN